MKSTAKLAAIATLFAAFALPAVASAQAAKVGSANVQKIFSDIKETKDLDNKLNAKGADLKKMQNDAQAELTAKKQSRDQFKPGTDTYDRANQELNRAVTQRQIEIQVAQNELVREQKLQTKLIYDKIVAAVSEVAKEKGYSVVVSQVIPPEPSDDQFDRLTADQLINLLRQQNLLYVDPSADLTSEVVARMDAKYAGGGTSSGANTGGANGGGTNTGGAPAGGTNTGGGTNGGNPGGAGGAPNTPGR